jgi:medium-chain acyl-[acyl-carrier-protein] hydrolase
MENIPVWTEEIEVKTYDTDFQGRWKPSSLVQTLLEAGTHHANHLGFDFADMLQQDRVWVLSRLKVRFIDLPTFGLPVVIKTWIKGIRQKIFFMRDFDIRAEDGRPLAAASFAMLLISPSARRILSPQSLGVALPDNGGVNALDESLDKINPPDRLPEVSRVNAGYSAVDVLGHVNTARYVEWVCDCFTNEEYLAHRMDWLQVNYINETRPGEHLAITAGPDSTNPQRGFVQGINLDSGMKSFEAVVGWVNGSAQV